MRWTIVMVAANLCFGATDSFESAQQFLNTHCQKCHQDKGGAGATIVELKG